MTDLSFQREWVDDCPYPPPKRPDFNDWCVIFLAVVTIVAAVGSVFVR